MNESDQIRSIDESSTRKREKCKQHAAGSARVCRQLGRRDIRNAKRRNECVKKSSTTNVYAIRLVNIISLLDPIGQYPFDTSTK